MNRKAKTMTTLLATAAAGMLMAAPAKADDRISFSFAYADLDLATTAGIAELHERIEDAGRKACGIRVGTQRNSLLQWRQERACYEAVVDAALARVEETADLRIAKATLEDASSDDSES